MNDAARIFLIDDDELIASMLSRGLKKDGYRVEEAYDSADIFDKIRSFSPDVVMLDVSLPDGSGIDILKELKGKEIDTPVVMLTADDTAETAVTAMKLGAVDYITKPFNLEEVKIILRNIIETRRLKQEVDYLRKVSSELFDREIIGDSKDIQDLKKNIEKLAKAHVDTVLITGESGTGKELVARNLHKLMQTGLSPRQAPFIGINCAAFPETLLESELFGYEKGAFTDAKSEKKGLFEIANKGTILLDEIGEMKPDLQSKLLRVLEERTVRRIGGKDEVPIDVTVIATTNKNLDDAVEKGLFRIDLVYRLNTFSLHISPLRERKVDIPTLAMHFLSHFSTKYNRKSIKGISPEAEQILTSSHWRGNVRELKNVIERIVVLESGDMILPEYLPADMHRFHGESVVPSSKKFVLPEGGLSLDELEKDLIIQALTRCNYNKTRAAKLLGMSYDSLRYQIKKFGLG